MSKVISGYLKIDGKLKKISTSRVQDTTDALEEKIEGETQRLEEKIASESQKLEERIATESQRLEESITSEVQKIEGLKSDVDKHIAESTIWFDNLEDRIDTIEEAKQDIIEDLDEIRDNAVTGAALSSDISSINSNMQIIEEKVETNNTTMKQYVDEQVEALSSQAASIILRDWRQ